MQTVIVKGLRHKQPPHINKHGKKQALNQTNQQKIEKRSSRQLSSNYFINLHIFKNQQKMKMKCENTTQKQNEKIIYPPKTFVFLDTASFLLLLS